MFGPCKVCLEKDKTLAILRDEVAFLRKQIARPEHSHKVTAIELEADSLMSGQIDRIQVQSHEQFDRAEQEAILKERDALLNGDY